MLILTRRIGESIMIADDIEIKVLNLRNKEIRLGIAAPIGTPVHRLEIYKKIKKEENKKTEKTSDES